MRRLFSLGLVGILIGIANDEVSAGFVFDTAGPPIADGGLIVGDHNWPFHRFEVMTPVTLGTVGGYFGNYSDESLNVFAAVVDLSGPADNPDSINLTTPDVLGMTLISIPTSPGAYAAPLPLTLMPGWYALQFGTGAFGASNIEFQLELTRHLSDLALTQFATVAIQASHPDAPPGFSASSSSVRFFATAIPEPSGVILFSLSIVGVCGFARRGPHLHPLSL